MRRAIVAALLGVALLTGTVLGQDKVFETFTDSFRGTPDLSGYQGDGVLVLDDRSFCAYILGGTFGSEENIDTEILRMDLEDNGYSKRAVSRTIRDNASQPITDDLLLDACVHNLTQFLHPDQSFFEVLYPDNPTLIEAAPRPPAWKAQPVIPESLYDFMAADSLP